MIQRIPMYRGLAVVLVLGMSFASLPVAAEPAPAAVSGSVISSVDQTPLAGARVHLADPRTGEIFSSAPVSEAGDFTLDNVPPATYEMAVESEGGLYVIDSPVALESGQTRAVTLAVTPAPVAPDPATAEKQKQKKRTGVWNNPLTAALIVVGSAVVIGLLIDSATDDNNDEGASPFQM